VPAAGVEVPAPLAMADRVTPRPEARDVPAMRHNRPPSRGPPAV
jgi:hypothetical protein